MNEKTFRNIELFGLYVLAFSLPIMETPMHIGLIIFVIGALGWRCCQRPLVRRKPDTLEWLVIIMFLVSLASTIANWPLPNGIKGLRNESSFLILFWLMYRIHLSDVQTHRLIGFLNAGVIVGLIWGLWEWHSGIRSHFEFHSAGVVTQSSIYLGISIFVMLGVFLDGVSGFAPKTRFINGGCLLFSVVCLILMGSRGAFLGFILAGVPLMMLIFRQKMFRTVMAGVFAVAVVILCVAVISPKDSYLRNRIFHLAGNFGENGLQLYVEAGVPGDMLRFEHWKVGFAQATSGEHVLLGIGPRNFTSINVEKFDFSKHMVTYPSIWKVPHHAHNLFLTKWCEEGILGLISFILFLSFIAVRLYIRRPDHHRLHWSWVASLGALIVPVVAGFFNSSFANEFAWLSMMLMGISMSRLTAT